MFLFFAKVLVKNNRMKSRIVTHSGSFHADEIFATALIKRFINEDIELIRTRDEEVLSKYTNDGNTWVIDVGRSYNEKVLNFDHHQASFSKTWPNATIPFSSCGLVWMYLKKNGFLEKHYSNEVINIVEERLIVKIDMHDNRVASLPQGIMFKLCNRENNTNEDFLRALLMAEMHLEDTFLFAERIERNRKKIREIEFAESQQIAIFHEEVHNIITPVSRETSAKIIVMPKANEESWSVRSIAKPHEGVLTPHWWRGLSNEELAEASGIEDLIFVHKAGFLAIVGSKESALEVAKTMLA